AAQQPAPGGAILSRLPLRRGARRAPARRRSKPLLRAAPDRLPRMTRIIRVLAAQLGPYAASLRALEEPIRYPIADGADSFRIDHGADYHAFFSRLGEAHFLLALEE